MKMSLFCLISVRDFRFGVALDWVGSGFSLEENSFFFIKDLGLANLAGCGPIFLFVLD